MAANLASKSLRAPLVSTPTAEAHGCEPAPGGLLTAAALGWLARYRVPLLLVPYVLLRLWNTWFLGVNQDVKRYFDSASAWLKGGVPYSGFPLEYPPGALPFFALPRLFAETLQDATGPAYSRAFAVEMLAFDLGILALLGLLARALVPRDAGGGDIARRARLTVAQLAYVLWTGMLGYLAFERYDLVFACLIAAWLTQSVSGSARHRWAADGLLAVSIWVKMVSVVYLPLYLAYLFAVDQAAAAPVAAPQSAQAWLRREGARRTGTVLALVAALVAPFYLLAGDDFFNFLTYHSDRGLQIESMGSSLMLMAHHLFGLPIGTRFAYGATEVTGAWAPALARISGPVLLGVTAWITALLAPQLAQASTEAERRRLLVRGVMALTLGLLCANKVFSPQYMLWLAPLVAATVLAGGEGLGHEVLALFVANAATVLILFFYYINLLRLEVLPTALLAARNLVLGGSALAFANVVPDGVWGRWRLRVLAWAQRLHDSPWLARAALALCVVWIVCANTSETTANDIWIQLRSGEDVWRSWRLPYTEAYSATVSGRPFIAHEWLSGVLFYASTLVLGDAGLSVMTAAVALAIFVCLYLSFAPLQRARLYYLPTLLYLNYLIAFRLLARPHVFTILAQAAMVMAIERWRRTGRWQTLAWLVPMQLVWINLHGAALFGPALMAMVSGCTLVMVAVPALGRAEARRMGARDVWQTGGIAVAMAVACFINPYGSRIVTFSLDLLGNEYAKNRVWEWTTPFLPMNISYYWLWIFMVGMAAVWSALAVRLTTLPLLDIAYTLLATYLGLRANRFMPDFAILAFPVIVRSLDHLTTRGLQPRGWRQQPWLDIGLATLLLANCFTYGYAHSAREHRPMFGWGYGGDMPYNEVNLLKKLHIRGVIFNEYSDGSLIINRLWPALKPVLDSRIDLYPLDFVAEYDQAYVQPQLLAQFLTRHNVDVVMLYKHRVPAPILQFMAGEPSWKLLSNSDARVLYVKRRALASALRQSSG